MTKIPGLFGFVQRATKKPAGNIKLSTLQFDQRKKGALGHRPVSMKVDARYEPDARFQRQQQERAQDVMNNIESRARTAATSKQTSLEKTIGKRLFGSGSKATPVRAPKAVGVGASKDFKRVESQARSAFANPRATNEFGDLSLDELNRRSREGAVKKTPAQRDKLRRENEAAQKRELADEKKASKRRGLK